MNQPPLIPDLHTVALGDVKDNPRLILPKFLRRAANDLPERAEQDRAHAILIKWADMETSGRLQRRKETSLRGEFLAEVFGDALGYTLFSENLQQWQMEPEFAVNGGTADAAIGFFSSEGSDPPRALMEIKGPLVNLDRDRSAGRTPVQQCWDYLNAVPACPWGIVSNVVSFRLYHRNHTPRDSEWFTLQELRSVDRFRDFYVLFGRGGLLPPLKGQKARADELLEQTSHRQREVGRELYRDYHANRVELIQHLRKAPHKKPTETAIHIAQKILDRIIFVAFCEDRDLLPEGTIEKAWTQKPPFTKVTNPRWQNFLALFRSIDTGNLDFNISPFNGGLFAVDDEVDNLQLTDKWTAFFKEVGGYDFRDEVTLDVLGHLFEQSITDLETLRASPDSWDTTPAEDASGKRKREGIYYTPPPITRYIVENTLGSCLAVRFAALARKFDIDPQAAPSEKTLADWINYHKARLDDLRRFRVCDMACGSGAFLIQAFDYLEGVYDEVLTALFLHQGEDDAELREKVSAWILRDNIFGADRSEEAVEITRLALWIRTAERGKTLADLSENIQCGNSIVDDPKADPLALDWAKRFPQVFTEGGFDCIVSNPPYVKLQNFRKREPKVAEFLIGRYRAARTGNFDLYLPFIERGLELLRPGGHMGFIAPNVWLFNEYGEGLRQLVAEKKALEKFVDFKSHQVFEDATTYTALQFFSTQPAAAIQAADAGKGDLGQITFYPVTYKDLGDGAWSLLESKARKIIDTMRQRSVPLADACAGIIVGIQTSADDVYHLTRIAPGRYWSWALNKEVELEDDLMKPLVSGRNIRPLSAELDDTFLLFPYDVSGPAPILMSAKLLRKKFHRTFDYLSACEERLRGREDDKMDHPGWYGYVYPKNLNKQACAKIMVPRLLFHLRAAMDENGALFLDNVDVGGVLVKGKWQLGYVAAILNSTACDFAWRLTSKPFRGEYRSANKQFIAPLPIPKAKDQKPLADLARQLSDLHGQRLEAMRGVQRRLAVDLAPAELVATSPLPAKLPGKLQAFDELTLGQLMDEMERFAKRKFKPADRARWDEYLTAQINAVAGVNRQIGDLTAELNDRANALYGLSPEDVKIIADSLA
jgi:type I restriction-modification system DNA methylase subunit